MQSGEDRRGPGSGSGTFEAHVTVEASDPTERERFRNTCRELGVKPLLIELPAGWETLTAKNDSLSDLIFYLEE